MKQYQLQGEVTRYKVAYVIKSFMTLQI